MPLLFAFIMTEFSDYNVWCSLIITQSGIISLFYYSGAAELPSLYHPPAMQLFDATAFDARLFIYS